MEKNKKLFYRILKVGEILTKKNEDKITNFEAECLKFIDFLKQNSIAKENIRVIKMDIEGAEYGVIPEK